MARVARAMLRSGGEEDTLLQADEIRAVLVRAHTIYSDRIAANTIVASSIYVRDLGRP